MLHLKKVLGAKPKEHVEAELETLATPWGETLDAANVLAEHPEPQCARKSFQVLNGVWRCLFREGAHEPDDDLAAVVRAAAEPNDEEFDCEIVVPFSPESALSRVNRQLQPNELLWYSRAIDVPELGASSRLLVHFQAVDYACAVRVNGQLAGVHVGGYTPFSCDVTELVSPGQNRLSLCVADPSEAGGRLRGKQRFDRGDIWYSAQSGIWQTAWLEIVPSSHVDSLAIEADPATGIVSVGARIIQAPGATIASGAELPVGQGVEEAVDAVAAACGADGSKSDSSSMLHLAVYDAAGTLVASSEAACDGALCAVAAHVPDARLWSPDDPYLYRLEVSYGDDTVESYCGFRTVEMRVDEAGVPRVHLNGEPLFIKGVLDQAYWSDSLMTPPSDEALVHDIVAMRDLGFNLMRKHIKVESARWYYHCDRLGMLVLQDMVSGGAPDIKTWHWSYKPTLFKVSWNHYRDDVPSHQEKLGAGDEGYRTEWTSTCQEVIRLLGNHPCIIGWSLFNEGWGQFDARKACEMVRALDPSRVIDATSGWYDQRCGDFSSVHNYFRDMKVWPDRRGQRAFFVSEFGGLTHRVDGHSALDEAYGYEPYDDIDEWRAAVRSLLAELDALEPQGLAGYIYTQVSDIEEETNGILTYDRRVNKLESTRNS